MVLDAGLAALIGDDNKHKTSCHAGIAQMVERLIRNQQVVGSSPTISSTVRLGDALLENPPKKLSAGACTC